MCEQHSIQMPLDGLLFRWIMARRSWAAASLIALFIAEGLVDSQTRGAQRGTKAGQTGQEYH